MAEAVMKTLLHKKGIMNVQVSSSGTNKYHKGEGADERAIEICRRNGIDLRAHIARRFNPGLAESASHLIAMAPDIIPLMHENVDFRKDLTYKIELFTHQGIDDPWYGGIKNFERCYDEILNGCSNWVDFVTRSISKF
jgi:protein-tyrosine-phosphatase